MSKVLKYSQTFFDCDAGGNSFPKYSAGQCYPLHDAAERHIALGIAEEIDVRLDAEDAAEKANRAQAKADAAAVAADQAHEVATVAAAAEQIAAAQQAEALVEESQPAAEVQTSTTSSTD